MLTCTPPAGRCSWDRQGVNDFKEQWRKQNSGWQAAPVLPDSSLYRYAPHALYAHCLSQPTAATATDASRSGAVHALLQHTRERSLPPGAAPTVSRPAVQPIRSCKYACCACVGDGRRVHRCQRRPGDASDTLRSTDNIDRQHATCNAHQRVTRAHSVVGDCEFSPEDTWRARHLRAPTANALQL